MALAVFQALNNHTRLPYWKTGLAFYVAFIFISL